MSELIIPITEIIKMLPHRYPFLLIDRVVDIKDDESITALKNVTFNEPHFMGHFPDNPIMPGVLIIEAMAQAAGIFAVHSTYESTKEKLVYFMSIENAKFRKPVVPGDSLYIHMTKVKHHRNVWKFSGEARVNDQKVAEAVVSAMIMDKE